MPHSADNPAQPQTSAPPAPNGPTLNLPIARHAQRVPPHLGKAEMARIRQAAYALPQVVKPGDYLPDHSPGFEQHLDTLGFILLQKPVAGQRPSRWIEPRLLDAALAHLDVLARNPAQVPNARPMMQERTAALEAQGLARHAGQWTRLTRQPLGLSEPGWQVAVVYRTPIDEAPIWRYYQDADAATLQAALGPPAGYPHAQALMADLEALLTEARQRHPRQLPSLLPRLQAECAAPQTVVNAAALDELKAACRRAFERWAHQAVEQEALQGLTQTLAFQGYPDTFTKARRLNRQVTLYVGPPNSGKTHAAFDRLALAAQGEGRGAYLAPLRLLALEGRDRLVGRGVPCSLLTGEENQPAPDARAVSSTIEMVNTQTPVDLAVIDEAQMLFDPSRGWAWTQAIVGVPAQEVIIICSGYAVPAIEQLLALSGERCEQRHFERKQQVQPMTHPTALEQLQKGDAVVAFSRRDVLTLRDAIAARGHPVSVIYGALPPEVRRREAERFAGGESHILVATDAIGMGLNLPIRRVLFSTLTKYDGVTDRHLDESEVHQIAGRAGRFGMHEEGFAGVLQDAEPNALRTLKELLHRQPRAPRDFKAPVAPNPWHIDTIASRLGRSKLREVLGIFVEQLKLDDAHFAVAELEQMLSLAEQLDQSAGSLSLRERFIYAQAPVDTRTPTLVQEYLEWSWQHARHGNVRDPAFLTEVDGFSRLERMEQGLRACTLWLWLDLRFPGVYGQVPEVLALREVLNDGIERQLQGHRPLAQVRRGRGPQGGGRGAGGGRAGGRPGGGGRR